MSCVNSVNLTDHLGYEFTSLILRHNQKFVIIFFLWQSFFKLPEAQIVLVVKLLGLLHFQSWCQFPRRPETEVLQKSVVIFWNFLFPDHHRFFMASVPKSQTLLQMATISNDLAFWINCYQNETSCLRMEKMEKTSLFSM